MRLNDKVKVVNACSPAALTGSAGDGRYIKLTTINEAEVVLTIKNSTSVTAGNIQLLQASNVAGEGAKVLTFDTYYKNEDTSASDAFTEATASNNCFLTLTTNSKEVAYKVRIPYENLDSANGFCCVRVDVANMANAVGSAVYLLDTQFSPESANVIYD